MECIERLFEVNIYKMKNYIITKFVADKRAALILKELNKLNNPEMKILDVGCGNMYITNLIKNKGYNIKGLDMGGAKDYKWMKKDPDYIMDARNMDFENNCFDVIIALEVIEHCDIVSEVRRVLKPGGKFFCSTPTPFTDWIRKILVFTRLLENQDFEGHEDLINLKEVPLKLLKYKKMFLGTSQFGVFTKE